MVKYTAVALTAVVLILSSFITGCAAAAPAATTPAATAPAVTTPAATIPATPAATTVSAITAGQLSDAGKDVFAQSCAKCHGTDGTGGAFPLAGDKANLGKYSTAQKLFDLVSVQMPKGKGGSLSQQAYLQVVAFLLVKNGFVQPTAALDAASLDSIKLTK